MKRSQIPTVLVTQRAKTISISLKEYIVSGIWQTHKQIIAVQFAKCWNRFAVTNKAFTVTRKSPIFHHYCWKTTQRMWFTYGAGVSFKSMILKYLGATNPFKTLVAMATYFPAKLYLYENNLHNLSGYPRISGPLSMDSGLRSFIYVN